MKPLPPVRLKITEPRAFASRLAGHPVTRPACAFALGAVTVLAFAPFSAGLLAVLALACLLWLLDGARTPAGAFFTGYAFGLGLLGFGVFWLRVSIIQFGGMTPVLAVAFTLAFIALMALYFGLFGWLLRYLAAPVTSAWSRLLLPAGLWTLVEWLRGWVLGGFPWLSLGYSQVDLPLGGYMPVLGVFGASLLVVLSASLLLRWRDIWPVVGLLAIWAGGLGLNLVDWTRPVGEDFQVSLVQGNIPQHRKWDPAMLGPTVRRYQAMTHEVAGSRLVVWPETAIPAFDSDMEARLLAPLHERLAGQGMDLLTGIPSGDPDSRYYNAMISLGASGRDHYYKRHLVPFGEYLPWRPVLGPVLDFLHIPMSQFSAGGERPPLIGLAGHDAGISICYEAAFGDEIRHALPRAAFLVNASNDAWFGDSLAPFQHLQIARARARETGRFMLRVTNTGITAIIDPRGGIEGTIAQDRAGVLTRRIRPLGGETPFVRWGNLPVVLLAFAVLLAVWAQRYRQRSAAGG